MLNMRNSPGGFLSRTAARLSFIGLVGLAAACSDDEEAIPACTSDANAQTVLTTANWIHGDAQTALASAKTFLLDPDLESLPHDTTVRLHTGNPGDESADEVNVQAGLVPDFSDEGDTDPDAEGHHPNANNWGNGITPIFTRPIDKQAAGLNEAGRGAAVEALQCSGASDGVRRACARALGVVKTDADNKTTLEVYEWGTVRTDEDSLVLTAKSLGDEPNVVQRVQVAPVEFGQDHADAAACEVYDSTGFEGSAHDQICNNDALAAQTETGEPVVTSPFDLPSEACAAMIEDVAQTIGATVEANKQ